MKTFLFIVGIYLLLEASAYAACSSPISRTNNSSSAILTSSKYNLDLNTVYTKVNNLSGDCLTDATITTAKIVDAAVTEAKIEAAVLAKFVPAGSIMAYVGTTAPTGYLLCDGSTVSRTTYSALFAVIGTTHGAGNGSTTFHLPDYRGRFLRGVDNSVGRDPDRASRTAMNSGGNTADNVGTLQGEDLKAHTHSLDYYVANTGTSNFGHAGHGSNTFTETILSGSYGGNETRPINASVNYIIKY
jgi:microcystin-dependent protein